MVVDVRGLGGQSIRARYGLSHRRLSMPLAVMIGRAPGTIQRLDERSTAALILNVLDGYTQRVIGAMFEVPEGTVSSCLSRARPVLRAALE